MIPPPYDEPVDRRQRRPQRLDARGVRQALAGVRSPARHHHRRQLVAAHRRRERAAPDERVEGQGARLQAARVLEIVGLRGGRSRLAAPDGAGLRRCPRRSSAPGSRSTDMDLVDMHEAFAAQVASNLKALASQEVRRRRSSAATEAVGEIDPDEAQRQRRLDRASVTRSRRPARAWCSPRCASSRSAAGSTRSSRSARRAASAPPSFWRRMTTESAYPAAGNRAAQRALGRVRTDGVAVVTYDVPGEPVNTLKASFAASSSGVSTEIASDPRSRRPSSSRARPTRFIAGADIEMLKARHDGRRRRGAVRAGHARDRAHRRVAEADRRRGARRRARRRLRGRARLPRARR